MKIRSYPSENKLRFGAGRKLALIEGELVDLPALPLQVLPGGKEDAQRKLALIEEELTDLDVIHTKAERSARRKARVILTSGFVVLFTQMVAFIYLTWCGAGGVNQGGAFIYLTWCESKWPSQNHLL